MKSKLGSLALIGILGLSTVVFAGCGNDNNGVTTKNVGRGHMITNQSNYRANSLGLNGTRNYRSDGVTGNGTLGANRLGPTTGNGINGTNGLFGQNETRGMGMYNPSGTSRYPTSGMTGFGTNYGTNVQSGMTGYNRSGTGSLGGGFHSMSTVGSHLLQLGSLTIVGASGMAGTNGMNGTSAFTGGAATNSRTLTVTDPKAVEAIDRVNRALASPSSLQGQSDTLAKDISYILQQASGTTAAGTR